MITLYQGPAAWGLPNISPFCIKIELYLRMTGLEFRVRGADPRKGPKRKIPWIRDGETVVADSQLIIEYLKQRYGDPLDDELTAEQRALGHVVRRALEEGSYWVGLHARWGDPAGWLQIRRLLQPLLPPLVGRAILPLMRRASLKALDAQGTGRHSPAEIYAMGNADITALSTILGDKPYLLGDRPSSYDATVFSFVISLLWAPFDNPLRVHGRTLNNLERYCRRINERYFPELKPPA